MIEVNVNSEIMMEIAGVIRERINSGAKKPAAIATAAFRLWLENRTSGLGTTATITQRIHYLFDPHIPVCKMCSGTVSWRKDKHCYSVYCSSACSHVDPDFITAQEQKTMEKHGVKHFSQSAQAKENRVKTAVERYGVSNNFWANRDPIEVAKAYHEKRNTVLSNMSTVDELISQGRTQSEIGNAVGVSQPRISSLLHHTGRTTLHTSKQSAIQRQLVDFLVEANVQIEENVRLIPPYDIDVYIPNHQLGIELNGIYWHGELNGRDRSYHLQKSTMCKDKGIRLVHIYDSEWLHKQPIVISRIRAMIGCTPKRVYARNCTVREVDHDVAQEFFARTHIQGAAVASVVVGLFYGDALVSAMSFAKPRFAMGYEYEMIRFSSELNTSVVGGASKLFSYFTKRYTPSSVITYADSRWNTGNVYEAIGFTYDGVSAPNYRYFNRNGDTTKLLSRNVFQKHKLSGLLERFDPEKTEWENMVANGYDRIWDCGNTRWRWHK